MESCSYVYGSYKGIQAMTYYRVAHSAYCWNILKDDDKRLSNNCLKRVSQQYGGFF